MALKREPLLAVFDITSCIRYHSAGSLAGMISDDARVHVVRGCGLGQAGQAVPMLERALGEEPQPTGLSSSPIVELCEHEKSEDAMVEELAAQPLLQKHLVDRTVPEELVALNRNTQQVQLFNAMWDDDGVYFYQAFRAEIADWALEHGTFKGCPQFNPKRMTWIKPSFGWMLYRSGYGHKPGQSRVLRVKLGHGAVAEILRMCKLSIRRVGAHDARKCA